MNATEFKAKCLAVLDEVATTGDSVTILKRGKPVASLGPPAPAGARYPQHDLFGTVVVNGDLLEPVVPEEALDLESETLD